MKGVAVIGCGLIGRRRAATAAAHAATALRLVVDSDLERAESAAREYGCDAGADWHAVLTRPDVDAVVVCTPNAFLVPIATAALESGRSVLIEKPMGRNAAEAAALSAVAARSAGVLKVGFNHRYHPALARAHELFAAGTIGRLVHMRARYGHGSRPGCEREWRGNADLAGGGELLDQGVHVVDLFHWFAGVPERVQAELQTAVWPLAPLEDNAFALLRHADGVVSQLHVSMTQWKNLFSFEVHGETGALVVDGLGGSYGTERLTTVRRNTAGGVPATESLVFDGPDESWAAEWDDFANALLGAALRHGTAEAGHEAMRTIDAIYAAAAESEAGAAAPSGARASGAAAPLVP